MFSGTLLVCKGDIAPRRGDRLGSSRSSPCPADLLTPVLCSFQSSTLDKYLWADILRSKVFFSLFSSSLLLLHPSSRLSKTTAFPPFRCLAVNTFNFRSTSYPRAAFTMRRSNALSGSIILTNIPQPLIASVGLPLTFVVLGC